jgi:hypothetical protein
MLLVIIWWIVSARKWFKGPVINVEHHMLGREEATVEGVEGSSDSDTPSVSRKAKAEGVTAPVPEVQ